MTRPTDTTICLSHTASVLADLYPQDISGQEALNDLAQLNLLGFSSNPFTLSDSVASHLTTTLHNDSQQRPLDALVAEIHQLPADATTDRYQLVLRPWLWWLTLASNTRIGGSPREYVGLPMGKSTVYVRRYVIRGLNVTDSENLSDKQGLQAASSDEELVHKETTAIASGRINRQHGTTMTVGEQLLSHTRGWNKRFISTTLTHKPITSTKGLFNSAFGKILIDLAKIPPEDIFDIHTPTALQHYGVYGGELKQLPSMKAQDQRSFFDETLLAAYDAIRTREVLIKGKIPFDSILCKSLGNLVVAVYCDDEPLKQSLFQKIEAAWKKASNPVSHKEELQYEIKSRKLVFYRFADAATAGKAVATAQAQLTAQDNAGAYAMAAFDFPEKIPPGAGTA